MVGRDGAATRKERLKLIARHIQATLYAEGEISFSKTIAYFQYDMGLTEIKIQEYLEVLKNLGQFVIDYEHDKIKRENEEEKPT
jgi:hypothetical protein